MTHHNLCADVLLTGPLHPSAGRIEVLHDVGRLDVEDLNHLAVDETVILLHPPLPLVGVSVVMERERQQNDSLVNGYNHQRVKLVARPEPGRQQVRPAHRDDVRDPEAAELVRRELDRVP